MTNLHDDITALQIKLAALEQLLLRDERLRAEYEELIKIEVERRLPEETSQYVAGGKTLQ